MTVCQLCTENDGWHTMNNTMGAFNSVLVNFMYTWNCKSIIVIIVGDMRIFIITQP